MTARLTLLGSALLFSLCVPVAANAQHTIACSAPSGAATPVATTGSSTRGAAAQVYRVDVSRAGGDHEGAIVVTAHAGNGAATSEPSGDARISKVLLRSAYKSEAVAQPSTYAQGATARDAIATFDEAAVQALPAGDVNVVLTTADGERVCRIRKKDRGTLLHTAKP